MSTSETATPATSDKSNAAGCCRKSCCSKKDCGTNGKCCVCCGSCLAYTGATVLTAAGLYSLFLWMTILWPNDAHALEGAGRSFSAYSLFFYNAGHYLGLNWVALPLVLIGVWLIQKKCCARCAPRLLFTYGLIITVIAFAGLICSGIDMAMLPVAHMR